MREKIRRQASEPHGEMYQYGRRQNRMEIGVIAGFQNITE